MKQICNIYFIFVVYHFHHKMVITLFVIKEIYNVHYLLSIFKVFGTLTHYVRIILVGVIQNIQNKGSFTLNVSVSVDARVSASTDTWKWIWD